MVLLTLTLALAQDAPPEPAPPPEVLPLRRQLPPIGSRPPELRRAVEMRASGMVLTTIGALPVLGGIGLIATTPPCTGDVCDGGAYRMLAGLGLIVLGSPFVGGGVALWTVGHLKMRQFAAEVAVVPDPRGLALVASF